MPGVYDDHLVFEVLDSAPSSSSSSSSSSYKNNHHNNDIHHNDIHNNDIHNDKNNHHHGAITPTSSAASSHGHVGVGGSKGTPVRRGSASASGSGSTALGEPLVTYTYRMPMKMTVTGCPLVIEQNTVGMSYVRGSAEDIAVSNNHNQNNNHNNHNNNNNNGGSIDESDVNTVHTAAGEVAQAQGLAQGQGLGHHSSETMDNSPAPAATAPKGQALLLMGKVCLNSDPLERSFRVKNEGCKPGKIKWKVRSLYPEIKTTTGLKTDIVVGVDGKVKSKIQFWTDVLRAAPFTIEPKAGRTRLHFID